MDAQSLRSVIKSARDLMRKDAGLNTDVDRIPQLAWMLFLKCFDDFEKKRMALDKNYKQAIPIGYRWSDWVGNTKLTGTDLIKFVNDDLFPKLSGLMAGQENKQRDIIASIFRELNNRVMSGYVLRQILDLVNNVNFVNTDDIHTMAKLYEDMLIEMRDAAGSNGEFYTPRPVIRFIVEQIKPNLEKSEKVLDPACGTGGFLIESLEFMKKKEKSKGDYKKLRTQTLFGIEKKPMPYLLAMMNLLLHEVDDPNIVRANTLSKPLKDITEKDQYDVIMTNPPFGGEEESGVSANLPVGMQTSDTALAFLLYIAYSLKPRGRCAIILPKGTPISGKGIPKKIRQQILENFNLHTIIKLPKGVFSPYTSIATNILFFNGGEQTKEIWYYEIKKQEGKNYSKSRPIQYEEFIECNSWWNNRVEKQNAWKVAIDKIMDDDYNLDALNPNLTDVVEYESPDKMLEDMINNLKNAEIILNNLKSSVNVDYE